MLIIFPRLEIFFMPSQKNVPQNVLKECHDGSVEAEQQHDLTSQIVQTRIICEIDRPKRFYHMDIDARFESTFLDYVQSFHSKILWHLTNTANIKRKLFVFHGSWKRNAKHNQNNAYVLNKRKFVLSVCSEVTKMCNVTVRLVLMHILLLWFNFA